MPKVDGTPTKGEITSEQLTAMKAEVKRLAEQLELERRALAEKSAAASLAEQLRLLRQERQQREREEREAEERGESPPALRGRPSSFSEEEADHLCQWISSGGSLNRWCKEMGRNAATIYGWMKDRPDFMHRYTQAHTDRADTLADDILDIADDLANCTDIAVVQAGRLRIEARKWIAAKLKPQKWGEKQVVEQTGSVTFNLGIPLRQGAGEVIDGNSLIQQANSVVTTDCKSANTLPAPSPSAGFPAASRLPSSSLVRERAAPAPAPATPHADHGA